MRTVALTAAALIGFAANSLLTRGALAGERLDAPSFTLVRVLAGAITLLLLVRARQRPPADTGSWTAAAMLAGYAILFTLAYDRIPAGVGALVLFGAVQITMIGTGLARGERPARVDWLGVGLAVAGLLVFTVPGATAPDPIGTALMAGAGACWGVYSLAGRTSRDPLGATAANFGRALIPVAVFTALSLSSRHVTPSGLLLAILSGALASGVAYTLWYAALPSLAAWRAAIVQTAVPVLTALGAVAWLGESVTGRLLGATALVTTGVLLTVVPAWHRK